jgi:uncharacterized protein (DUF1499 family)
LIPQYPNANGHNEKEDLSWNNYYFSSSGSYPTKTIMRILLHWTLIYLLWVGSWLGISSPVMAQPMGTASLASPAALPGLGSWFAGTRPPSLGVKDGKLAPCPTSPNCVVSQGASDREHEIAPLAYTGDRADAMAILQRIVATQPRTQIIEQTDDYLYAEFTSRLMGFVDDVEFYFDPDQAFIQVRSASRLGESDLGVNRKRIEAFRLQFMAQQLL